MKNKNDAVMKIVFWGVRGSTPTPGRKYNKYGGNTPCVEVRCGDTILIFDAGTGIREFGYSILKEFGKKPIEAHILISHTHWDHIQGFPFFTPVYMKDTKIFFYGGHGVSTLEKLILGQMSIEYFPVTLFELASDIKFVELKDDPFYINDVKIYFTYLFHPSLSLGFRVEYKDKIFVYATDNEILNDPEMTNYNIKNVGNLIKNADVLVADSQYTEEEYKNKIGWGHTSIEEVIRLSNDFGVKNLFTFHHDPLRSDTDIDEMIKNARSLVKKPLKLFGARERQTIYL